MALDIAAEAEKIGKQLIESDEEAKALREAWREVLAVPLPKDLGDALRFGIEETTQSLFANLIPYSDEDRKKDRQKLVRLDAVLDAMAAQVYATFLQHASKTFWDHAWGEAREVVQLLYGFYFTILEILLSPIVFVEKVYQALTDIRLTITLFIKKFIKAAGFAEILKIAGAMELKCKESVQLCRKAALPSPAHARRRVKHEKVRR